MSSLILLGGSVISGAEIVLKDYLLKTQNQFKIITSTENFNTKYYNLDNIEVIGKKEFCAIGADKSLYKKIIKILNLVKITFFLKKYIKENKIERIITNNTIDILYLSFLNLKNISVVSFIHDILNKESLQSKIILRNDKKIQKYVAVSKACKNALINIGISESKIELIYNGVDLKKINLSKKVDNSFIFVGMIDECKNPMEYVEFIKKVSEKIGSYTAKVIFKHSTLELLDQMKKSVREKKLKIEFLENLSREEVQDVMKESKYLFICSNKDTLPTVVLEGMNNSVFIIGKNVDGIPEMVNNETGILYDSKNELLEVVDKIIKMSKQEYENKIFKSYELLREKFDNENKIKIIDLLLKNISRKDSNGKS